MAMLSARGVEIDTIDEVIAAGLATATVERVGRRPIESCSRTAFQKLNGSEAPKRSA
jgi:hypothetical protein